MPHQDTALYKAMFDAVRRTFENMAFVEVSEQTEEVDQQVPTEAVWVSILINDPVQGEVRLAIPKTLLVEMTANMFGIEAAEVKEEQTRDIIAESLNTLAGLFMTNLLPDDQTYQLGLPEHGEGAIPEIEEGSIVWNLQIEGAPLLLVASGISLTTESK
jgi:CheY-specific phosphatase CheX